MPQPRSAPRLGAVAGPRFRGRCRRALLVPLAALVGCTECARWAAEGDDDDGGVHLLQYSAARSRGPHAAARPDGADIGAWGFDLAGVDPTVHPGDDFYRYANGKWLKKTTIPGDRTSWSSFTVVSEAVTQQLKWLLGNATSGSLLGNFYKSWMEEGVVNQLGTSPMRPSLDRVAKLKDAAEFAGYVGSTNFGFGNSPFAFYVGADPENPKMYVAKLDTSGLGLPDRDYYLEDSFAAYKEAYGVYIEKALGMVDWPDAKGASERVLAFEGKIAKVTWPRTKLRDPVKTYNKMTLADLAKRAPGFAWEGFFRAVGQVPADATLIVSSIGDGDDNGVPGVAGIIGEADMATLRDWAAFHLVSGSAPYLSHPFVEAYFDFYGKALSGQKVLQARWKRAVSSTKSAIADALGEVYVKQYFPQKSEEQMDELTALLKKAFAARIQKVPWMGTETKVKALEKLARFRFEVGGPKKYLQYEGLVFKDDELYANLERAIAWSWNLDLRRRGTPVDDGYWDTPPTEVNAFFDPLKNRCVFLAAILQPPFFMPEGDPSVNFGAIGSVIGHEMTHGFDDQGRQYDADGRLHDWWAPEDAKEFKTRAAAYGSQFANFTQGLPAGTRINPQLTMGENIADLGGLTIALDAYHMWRGAHAYKPKPPMMEGFSPEFEGERRFFAGWEQVWRAKHTPSAVKELVTSDPHSPSSARGTIPPRNLDAWYSAYAVPEGQTLYLAPVDRVHIW